MEIISHRGYWKNEDEKNQAHAFDRSFGLGFGTETDVRDCAGRLVISHDMPSGNEILFEDLLKIYVSSDCEGTLALNIKADGLSNVVSSKLKEYGVKNYVFFDMSIPDTLSYRRNNLNYLVRFSEFEVENRLWEDAEGVWFDSFEDNFINFDMLDLFLKKGLKVYIVSAELHKRDHFTQWEGIKNYMNETTFGHSMVLCTDYPEIARRYFYGK
ncbi:hypothetical protein K6Q96_04400 [Grimontia kaedaensis]|uniref:Phosphodiesterase n=1 Tax=Grimontia kaedaensis TaxID=2872157 RepID=A0ABY4WUJ1_9GAMM|nr:hypothetical protein [Grimontia kaedaensis]USH03264.1 hypothetical protein K6Q96_04400 [Grimontia kaedaensis]